MTAPKPKAAKAVKPVRMWAVMFDDEIQIIYAYRKTAREDAFRAVHPSMKKHWHVRPVLVTPAPRRTR